jgi:aspartate/methionine/tyrosine aminotransferase
MVVINSPNNPTGWTIAPEQQRVLVAHCRRHGIWIVADDVYERLIYSQDIHVAPSFLTATEAEDRLISVNSFSKAWRMTGWRVGWLLAPEPMMSDLTKVIEYNTSCVPEFSQQGAIAALDPDVGEAAVRETVAGLSASRALLLDGLRRLGGIEVPETDGAMYAFFRIDGRADDVAVAKDLVAKVGLGLAPGSSFGAEGAGWLRWCFAASEERVADGLARLHRFLRS